MREKKIKEDALASIDLLLSKRLRAKKKQNYREADGLREQLMAEFGVYVDDKKQVIYFPLLPFSALKKDKAVLKEDHRCPL